MTVTGIASKSTYERASDEREHRRDWDRLGHSPVQTGLQRAGRARGVGPDGRQKGWFVGSRVALGRRSFVIGHVPKLKAYPEARPVRGIQGVSRGLLDTRGSSLNTQRTPGRTLTAADALIAATATAHDLPLYTLDRDSLTGRVHLLTVWPLTQEEVVALASECCSQELRSSGFTANT